MLEKLKRLRKDHLKSQHQTEFYPYQELISDKIIESLIQNLRLSAGASKEDVKKLKLIELPVEISRQSGKTTAVVYTIEFIMLFFPEIFKRPISIGIFAPQKGQAKTDFDRLKAALRKTQPKLLTYEEGKWDTAKEESNASTLVLPNESSCYIFPVTPTSAPESKTLDLIIFEESQDLDDKIIKEQIWPMGAATNAPRIYLGTAGTQICWFYRLGQTAEAVKLYYDEICAQRSQTYESSNDARHLIYEQTVKQEIEKHGRDADEIARPYFGKWLLGGGQYCTQEQLEALVTDRKRTNQDKQHTYFVGIDTAKNPDSTVVTMLRWNPEIKKKELVNWLELRGDNYKDQFDIIYDFISRYNVQALAIDSTGQGDFMPDMFERETIWQNELAGLYRVKFSAVSKDVIYKNLKVSIQEFLTTLPNLDTREGEHFKQQMLDLQQEYKGQLLSVHHPDSSEAHDDYPDSWALAEYAFARWNENNGVSAEFINVADTKERDVRKDKKGKIEYYWPE